MYVPVYYHENVIIKSNQNIIKLVNFYFLIMLSELSEFKFKACF